MHTVSNQSGIILDNRTHQSTTLHSRVSRSRESQSKGTRLVQKGPAARPALLLLIRAHGYSRQQEQALRAQRLLQRILLVSEWAQNGLMRHLA